MASEIIGTASGPEIIGPDTVRTIELVNLAVKNFADEVRSVFPVVKAYLFGSWAKGTAAEYSDVDVCFFLENYGDRLKAEVLTDITRMTLDYFWVGIEPHVFKASSLEADRLFVHEILRTGIEI
jgi:predicted nucleotidyltransferase